MGTVFLTNLAAVAGKYERYDVLSAILDLHAPDPPRNNGLKPIVWVLRTHNRLPLQKLRLLKTSKKTLASARTFFFVHEKV